MPESGKKTFFELVQELQVLVEEVVTLAKNSEFDMKWTFTEFAFLIEKLIPNLTDIKSNDHVIDRQPVWKALESLQNELRRGKDLIRSPGSRSGIKQIENLTRDIGRSLGLVLFSMVDASQETKEKIVVVQKELMNAKFESSVSPSPSASASPSVGSVNPPSPIASASTSVSSVNPPSPSASASPSVSSVNPPSPSASASPSVSSVNPPSPGRSAESGFGSEFECENEIEEEGVSLSIEDVALKLKYGNEDELKLSLLGLSFYIRDKVINNSWTNDKEIVPTLVNRLGSGNPENRLSIIHTLRMLASEYAETKEKLVEVGSLSALVKSLTRDVLERRETVGLLFELSDLSAVKRRIGKIQGCIVMLVSIFNGNDPIAAHDAGKLLIALSSNTQNVLHMAEAGYFMPMVQNLREGSDMNKILMATVLSRMELTDQSKTSLGESGAVEPLVKMFKTGNLEAKLTALNALLNLSSSVDNVKRLIGSGIVATLLQLLFSVTSVLMTLREPASAILARIAQSESILVNQDVAQQMLSLLNLSSPVTQHHLLQALNSIASHSTASTVRIKMKESGAFQLLLPFLTDSSPKIRTSALNLLYTLSKDSSDDLKDQLGETHIENLIAVVSSSTSESEKAAAIGILSNLPVGDKKATEILKKSNLLSILIAEISSSSSASTSSTSLLLESIAGIIVRFTMPSDRKLQLYSVELGVIPSLVKMLSSTSSVAKSRAATALAQLSQNSVILGRQRKYRWTCMPSSTSTVCEVHDSCCTRKSTFCLVKAEATSPLVQILEGKDREADEAVLGALATLLQDDICESGSSYLAKISGVGAIVRVLETGNLKAQEKALWMLERIFKFEEHKVRYGPLAQVVLIDLAQNGDQRLRPNVAKLLAEFELLQVQSSYF